VTNARICTTIARRAACWLLAPIAPTVLAVAALSACASRPPGADYPRSASVALAAPEETRLGSQFAGMAAEHAGASGFRIITNGVDGFLARAQIIDAAERTLDLQYFIFRGDETGRLLTDGLLRAADRGVRVRVLVDDGDTMPGDEQILALNAHPLVEVRVFNPFAYRGHSSFWRGVEFLFNIGRLDYRMHNKLLVADNSMALVGGRNIGNQYFQVDPGSQFADDDVFAAGPIARELSTTFDEYWNSPQAIPARALGRQKEAASTMPAQRERARWHPAALVQPSGTGGSDYVTRIATGEPYAGLISGRLPLVWAHARVFCDSPDKKEVGEGAVPGRLMTRSVSRIIAGTQSELLMVTPYFVPAGEELDTLHQLRGRNVSVSLITNSLESTRDLAAHAGYTHYRTALLADGVSLYEVRAQPGTTRGSGQPARLSRYGHYGLHGKLIVFDRRQIFIGSMNFDQRSKHLNTEVGLLIDSPDLAAQTASRFEAMSQIENAYELSLRPRDARRGTHLVWHTKENGLSVEYGEEPAQSPWRRLKVRFLSLLPLSREL
jgi:cardiolipin synthase C